MAALAPPQHDLTTNLQNLAVSGASNVQAMAGGNSPTTHYDGSPVDAASAAVAQQVDSNVGAPASKKGKTKKATDPLETSKLLAAKISQLESDKAGEKDQEAEIAMCGGQGTEREVKKANRDLSNLLSNIESPLSRLEAVQKKYTDLLADMRRLDREHVKSKKRSEQLQKERDHGRSELSKTVTMKEKLEKLCRELQKENKKMTEEHKALEETEKRKREQLNERFDGLLSEVQDVVNQKEDPGTLKINMEVDELFKHKFKSFIDQYELRELHFHSQLRTKELEVQYNMGRFEQQKKIAEQEAARSRALSAQVTTFSQTETELRTQLNIYVEKFKQVEDTLNNSNDLFLTFRKEMEDMSKKMKRLEKDNMNLTRKHDMTNRNILEMAEERTRANKEMEGLRKRNDNLEKLCRGMQAQGRAGPVTTEVEGEHDDEGTESDYEYDDEDDDEEGSEEPGVFDEDVQGHQASRTIKGPPRFGPIPPPSAVRTQPATNGTIAREVNGTKH